jgi:hypothetical protein
VLTEPPLLDLICREGEHREQLDHYLDDNIGHHRSGRDRRIDLQALEEIPQALEQVEKGVVA